MLAVGNGPSHGQEADDGETQEPPSLAGPAAAEPVVTRAWAHDDFGRIVFDWPRAVEYEAGIEERTLTVMFDQPLKTTFWQVERYLGAYISDVNLSPDGRSVTASLTGDYRLRTFALSGESGLVKIVVNLLADGGAGRVLAQAPASLSPEPSPEAVPGDASPHPTISGDSPLSPAQNAPVDVSAADAQPPAESEADPTAEAPPPAEADSAAEETPAVEADATDSDSAAEGAAPSPPRRGEEPAAGAEPMAEREAAPTAEPTPEAPSQVGAGFKPAPTAAEDPPQAETGAAPEATPSAEAASTAEPTPEAPPLPQEEAEASPQDAPSVQADADTPPTDPQDAPEETPSAEAVSTPETVPEAPTVPEDTPQAEAETGPAPAPVTVPSVPVALAEDQQPEAMPPPLLSIPVAQSRLFRLDVPVASVFVANPDIADVQLVSSGVLFVVGKAVGRTSVAALDADSALVAEWTIATIIDVEPVRAALGEVEALKNIAVRQLNRGVELSGTVASVAEADLALRLTTTALPEEIPVGNRITVSGAQQINLEVQIAEVQRSVSETLGINWEVIPNLDGDSLAGFRVGRLFLNEETARFIAATLPGGQAGAAFGAGIAGRTTIRGLVDALASAELATVLARPNVTAISGETASFFSGGEYPLPAGFEDGAIIFEYKKYGVLLDFVPTIVDSGRIVLTVRPEVSQRSETDSLTVTGIDIPVINVRRAETTVEVGDGESIVIAGLYRDQGEATEAGVPVLKDIPLLNLLFGTRTVRSNATELIVVVTARLTDAATVPPPADRQTPGRRLRGYHY